MKFRLLYRIMPAFVELTPTRESFLDFRTKNHTSPPFLTQYNPTFITKNKREALGSFSPFSLHPRLRTCRTKGREKTML
jgi:hypothetical protein